MPKPSKFLVVVLLAGAFGQNTFNEKRPFCDTYAMTSDNFNCSTNFPWMGYCLSEAPPFCEANRSSECFTYSEGSNGSYLSWLAPFLREVSLASTVVTATRYASSAVVGPFSISVNGEPPQTLRVQINDKWMSDFSEPVHVQVDGFLTINVTLIGSVNASALTTFTIANIHLCTN